MQLEKAPSPILVTLSGIVTELNFVQALKALLPILVTLSGMIMQSKSSQPPKALSSMLVTVSGIVTELSYLLPNALLPIFVTPYGISTR